MKDKLITVNLKSIVTGVLVIFGLFVSYKLRTLLLSLFISIILSLAIYPAIKYLQKKGLPKLVSVALVYFSSVLLFIGLGAYAIRPMFFELRLFLTKLPEYLNFSDSLGVDIDSKSILELLNFGNLTQNAIDASKGVFLILTILVFTGYILLDYKGIKTFLTKFFPKNKRKLIFQTVNEVERVLGNWLRGQLILMLFIGTFSYVGLKILGVEYALSLALIAGLFEVLPIVGPILALIPAFIVSSTSSLFTGIAVLVLYILIQQVENNILVPKVMQKVIGFNPLVTMFLILAGVTLFGALGAIMSIPSTIIGVIVFKKIYREF